MTYEQAVAGFRAADPVMRAEWLRCPECHGTPPWPLVDLALTVSTDFSEMGQFLEAAHCHACLGHCAECSGYVSPADLEDVIACFEGASSPPSLEDWWAAVFALKTLHAGHRADQHRRGVCSS